MRYRQPATGKPRRSVSKLVPAPVAGLIANRNLAVSQPKSKPQGAYVLENFLPTAIGARMRGEGIEADLLRKRFRLAKKRLGFAETTPPLDCSRFGPPPRAGDQLSLF